ncbi:hypothetical protein Pla22_02720 [Rubripirellula amarantea]|uniref:Glycosyl transferases group 1 n=1 Tax=Rubripirellula amarantea TaxID=2527999 RepID=A0A5C5WPH7_9BACT|nr:glycosyltransferase [Rubripirellula amarantea]TWT52646.1 hypothetical protein Pla22_02720 [Rubripirellula amarantea]
MKTTLAVLDEFPFPPRDGVTYPIASHLSRMAKLGPIDLVTTLPAKKIPESEHPFRSIHSIIQGKQASGPTRLAREVFSAVPYFTRAIPDFSSLDPNIRDGHYDVLYTSPAWLAGWSKHYPRSWKNIEKQVLCLNDCVTERFVRDLLLARKNYLAFDKRLRHLLRGSRYPWMGRVERKLLDQFDAVLVQSQRDLESVVRHCGESYRTKLFVVPNGIKEHLLSLQYQPPEKPVLMHLGSLFGNRRGLMLWFLREVFPKVKLRIPEATIRLCGKISDADRSSLGKIDGVEVVGFVDTLEDAFKGVSVSIAPLLMLTGLINKVTDSMAAGVPCTGMGAFGGIPDFVNGKHGIECRSAQHWCDELVNLLNDRSRLLDISSQARTLVQEHLTWDRSHQTLMQALGA